MFRPDTAPPPRSGRVVFVDWHGVLSRDPFWASIRDEPRHPLHSQLMDPDQVIASMFDQAQARDPAHTRP
ncbi:hypothetical protein FH608_041140 [Nonomuraea phyllanthi]|uniref:Uncharacterized protein n=1 Tax=Nonomuraea phyllanthi TaxID=2219224 RepID=A0A5C4VIY0_9ACTN|nr:hypothetical protein [Nonomuraea phyllanthi]KAB8189234.1 hypothetical protein FH608_041140 [Nonomuraea phyllanthi]